jgi:GH24 family phage-related lysozyme (muramidase)
MKVSITEDQLKVVQSKLLYEQILDDLVFKLSLITEDGKTEPDMEWDFEPIKKQIDLSKLWVKTKEDALEYIKILKEKISDLPPNLKKKIFKYAIYSFIGLISLKQIGKTLDPPLQQSVKTEKELIKKVIPPRIRNSSESLFNHLKWEEGSIRDKGEPVLTVYDLGDGAYTVGYGHAIFPDENEGYNFLPNYEEITPRETTITKENAETLLKDDIKIAEGIVNKILNDWEDIGIKPVITQGMYDAMVSMAYNMGPGIRKTDFIQLLKKGDIKGAREQILTTSQHLFDDFPGLEPRRQKEYKMFT